MFKLTGILSLVLVLGCGKMFEPVEEWVPFDPPIQYRVWHNEVENCLGARRSFEKIQWRKVLGWPPVFGCGGSDIASGCYVSPNVIYIVESALNSSPIVKAEIAHYVVNNTKHDYLHEKCRLE